MSLMNRSFKVFLVLFCLSTSSSWAAPGKKLINVQGKLTDATGKPLSGNVTVTFRLYTSTATPVGSCSTITCATNPTGCVWVESQGIAATNGLFNVTLGNACALDPLPFNTPYYLGMQVSGDANELQPRQLLGASAYALGSLGDFNVQGHLYIGSTNQEVQGSLVPVGTILPFAGLTAPSGYFPCDGSAVSRSTYSALFAVIGTMWGGGDGSTLFNLPDLRRRTVVGAGGAGSTVLNNTVGSVGGEEAHVLSIGHQTHHTRHGQQSIKPLQKRQ